MAIMDDGRIVASGRPADLTARLTGTIWSKTVAKQSVAEYRESYRIISTRLYAGQTVLHAYDESDPGNGFTLVEPGLEDVYFHTLSDAKTPVTSETAG